MFKKQTIIVLFLIFSAFTISAFNSTVDAAIQSTPQPTPGPTSIPSEMQSLQVETMSLQRPMGDCALGELCSYVVQTSSDDTGVLYSNCGFDYSHREVYFGECDNTVEDMYGGFHFDNVKIPVGAIIDVAYVGFTLDYYQALPNPDIEISFFGHDTGDSQTFSDLTDFQSRATTASNVSWIIDNQTEWLMTAYGQTPSLVSVVQEIVDNGQWTGDMTNGAGMSILFQNIGPEGTYHRRIFAFDRGDTNFDYPHLVIQYSIPGPLTLTVKNDQGENVSGAMQLNPDGFPEFAALRIDVTIDCPFGGSDCNYPFTFKIDTLLEGRFYPGFVPLKLLNDLDCDIQGVYTRSSNEIIVTCDSVNVVAGTIETITWDIFLQPSRAASYSITTTYDSEIKNIDFSVPVGEITPIIFVPGTSATLFPGEWDTENSSVPWLLETYVYGDIFSTFEKMGYERSKTLFLHPWDWLESHYKAADALGRYINSKSLVVKTDNIPWVKNTVDTDFDLIGHSGGGLVAKTYVQSEYWNNNVRKLVLIGAPLAGAVPAYQAYEGINGGLNPLTDVLSELLFVPAMALKQNIGSTCPMPGGNEKWCFESKKQEYDFYHNPIYGPSALPEFLIPFPWIDSYDYTPPSLPIPPNINTPTIDYVDYLQAVGSGQSFPFGRQVNTLLECGRGSNEYGTVENSYKEWGDDSSFYRCMLGSDKMSLLTSRLGLANITVIYSDQSLKTEERYDVIFPATNQPVKWENGQIVGQVINSIEKGDGLVPVWSAKLTPQIWGGTNLNFVNILVDDAVHGYLQTYAEGQQAIANAIAGNDLNFSLPSKSETETRRDDFDAIADNLWAVFGLSPIEMMVTDSQGRRTGFDHISGQIYEEIPNSFYISNPVDGIPTIMVFSPSPGDYDLDISGTDTGSYNVLSMFGDSDATVQLPMYSGNTVLGQIDSFLQSVPVSSLDVPTQPDISAGPDITGLIDTDITFSGTATDINPTDILSYSWDFGDGNITTGTLSPSHAYSSVGVFVATLTVDDGTGYVVVDTVEVTIVEIPFAILGLEGTLIKNDVTVISGDIGTNNVSAGPFLSAENVELKIENNVTFSDASSILYGDSVVLKPGVAVYDVFYNEIDNQGTILGSVTTPFSFPFTQLLPSIPAFPVVTRTDVTINQNGALTLASGDYGILDIGNKASVTFSGGLYTFISIETGRESKVYYSGITTVLVDQTFDSGPKLLIAPENGSGLKAGDMHFIITGLNSDPNNPVGGQSAVEIGNNSNLQMHIYVTNGTFWLDKKSNITGTIIGKWVVIENTSTFTWEGK